ncbi:polymeric immunoglobulin receptor-like protein [Labeo rohita]|nr:polymeric immunoglobulin receptor-like protein [Labeo rohita]
MTGLRLTDSGWYWCSVGDLQVPVQLTVTKPKRTFTTIPTSATPSETDMCTPQPAANRNPTKRIQIREEHFKSTRHTMPCENQMTSNRPADANSSASVDEGSVIYSSVITFHKAPSTSVNSECEVIYSTVK